MMEFVVVERIKLNVYCVRIAERRVPCAAHRHRQEDSFSN